MEKTQERTTAVLQDSDAERSTWATVKLGSSIAVVALFLLFLLQNFQTTEIRFLWLSWSMSVTWALLGSAIAGAIVTVVLGTIRRRRAEHAASDAATASTSRRSA